MMIRDIMLHFIKIILPEDRYLHQLYSDTPVMIQLRVIAGQVGNQHVDVFCVAHPEVEGAVQFFGIADGDGKIHPAGESWQQAPDNRPRTDEIAKVPDQRGTPRAHSCS